MDDRNYLVYGYRWVVLIAFMAVVALNQLLWITFAPITGSAASYYGVSDLSIGLLSMSFMVVYILVSIPASWTIDTYGIRVAVGIGAVLTGFFGLLRGLLGADYNLVLLAQVGIALGQPFILNAITTVAARWFPSGERATASGLGTLAMYLGILAGLTLTPYLSLHAGIHSTLIGYGVAAVVVALFFFLLIRERPKTPPGPPEEEVRSLVFDGLRASLRQREFLLLLAIFFVGLGVFNAATTWIEDIVRPRGFSIVQAGNIGGLMILGGIVGALVIPILSDRSRKRTPYLVLAVVGATLGLIGVTFTRSYGLLLASAFVFGFFLLSAGPVGFQYGAEITHPTPEGTSNGLLLLMGQISGILFIVGMDSLKSAETGSMTLPLVILIALMVLALALSFRLKEASVFLSG
ncbi:MAG: MFS transporter [Anaerolineales bacterium]